MAPVMLLVSNHPQQYEATSMNDSTSVLFGLEDEFVVSSVERLDHRPVVRVKDLDASGQAVELWWRKRRLRWLEPPCPLAYG